MTRITELQEKILQARHHYYNGQAQISDQAYDAMIDELSQLDPKNLAVIGIGSEPVSNWEKYAHQSPMGSLNKSQTIEEFSKWAKEYVSSNDEFLITLKLDGLSVSIIYKDGILVKAATRGSGIVGELITPNVARMNGVPLRLKQKINATIRGEILLSKQNHQDFFSEYSNTRNAASGLSRRYDGEGSDKLDVLAYQLLVDEIELPTQYSQFIALQNLGFQVPTFYLKKTSNEVVQIKDQYQASLRSQYPFDLDGLVIHLNNTAKHYSFGETHGRPKASIAYKFDSIAKEAYVQEIIVQTGNSGRITPVAIFNPKVNLMGADVERASLHNFTNIATLGIDIGATVLVCRANDVIPFVEEVVESTNSTFQPPLECPSCHSLVIENGEYVQCSNTVSCPAQLAGRVKNWIKELNVLEWGQTLIERLVESGKVKTVADLYKLTVEDLTSIERMGKKSAKKCYDILWKTGAEMPLEVFLGALSIPMIGKTSIKTIMGFGCNTLVQFQELNAAAFEMVPGIGPTKAKSLVEGLKANKDVIEQLLKNGVKIMSKADYKIEGQLSGVSFVLTGTMENKREVLEEMIANAGGIVKSGVGKSVNYLVIADPESTSTKTQKARAMGVKMISEQQLLDMLES